MRFYAILFSMIFGFFLAQHSQANAASRQALVDQILDRSGLRAYEDHIDGAIEDSRQIFSDLASDEVNQDLEAKRQSLSESSERSLV